LNAMDYLEKLGLLDLAFRKVNTMSGGEKQRVTIAKAIVHGAKVIVADDPVAGLDPHSAEAILKDFRLLCDSKHITVLFTVPQIDWVQKYATRMMGIAGGSLQYDISGRRLTSVEKQQIGL
jgi:phosphonate transport system ATP-binding protein